MRWPKKESITLTDDEKAALKNSEKDFWYDLSDIDGAKKLGVEKKGYLFVHGKVCNSPEISGNICRA